MRHVIIMAVLLLNASLLHATPTEWVFVAESFPPFSLAQDEMADNTPPKPGASPFAHIIYQTCRALQRRCSIKIYPWRRALPLAEQGQVAGIYPVLRNRQREQAFFISPMLIHTQYGFFTQRGDPLNYRRAADLAGYAIAVYGPSGTSAVLDTIMPQVPNATIQLESTNLRVLKKLAAGRYGSPSAAVVNVDVAHHLITTAGIDSLREAGVLAPIDYAIGLSRISVDRPEAEAFNQAVAQLIRDGQANRWIEQAGLQPYTRR